MYKIKFYADKKGREPVKDYLKKLRGGNILDRKQADKIDDYLEILQAEGKAAGLPYVKRLQGELWELRPTRDRIIFAAWIENSFVLLSHFTKKTQKTPRREIDLAQKRLQDFKEREKIG